MGDTHGAQAPFSSPALLTQYGMMMPNILRAVSYQQPEVAKSQLKATQATQEGYNALNLDQAQKYAPALAKVGQDIMRSNSMAGSEINRDTLMGAGGQAALAATELNRIANPEYYGAARAASKGAQEGVDNINMKGLSPGESNAVERSLNQYKTSTGNLGIDNPTNLIASALNFGGAFNSKLPLLNAATNTATNTAGMLAGNGGVSPVNIALGQPNASTMSNWGTSTFNPTNASTQNASGSNAFNFGSGMLSNMYGLNNTNASGAYGLANANSLTSSLNGVGSAMTSC